MRVTEGVVVAGRYRLEKRLARGGMGSVWVAQHTQLDAPVAVKFMDSYLASSPAARARFEREAKAAAQIHSPHIVGVHDYGIEDETPFLVMELLHGEDLGSRLKRVGPLSLAVTADIIAQVARALRVAHAAGIVHRDLKPGNIFLVQNDDVEIAKVLDFGIAKVVKVTEADEPTDTGQLLGSPQYMSPEQTRSSRDVDARSDLWALAVIAYRMITGKLPFSGELGDVLVKICTEQAPPPSIHNPELSPTVDRFFERALAKLPDHRFQTATAQAQMFALAAGVNLPSIDKEPPKKLFRSTLRLDGAYVPSPDAATAARFSVTRDSTPPVTVTPAPREDLETSLDPPTRPTMGAALDAAPESTTRPLGTRSLVEDAPVPAAPPPRPVPPRPARFSLTPTAKLPVVPSGPTTTDRMPVPAEPVPVAAPEPPGTSPEPRTAPRARSLPPVSSRRSMGWALGGSTLTLIVGALLAGRIFSTRSAPAPADTTPPAVVEPSPAAKPLAKLVGDTPSAPAATAPTVAPSAPAGAEAEAVSRLLPVPAALTLARVPRAAPPVMAKAISGPPAQPAKVAAGASAAPPPPTVPPPPAPPPRAPNRMFGTED